HISFCIYTFISQKRRDRSFKKSSFYFKRGGVVFIGTTMSNDSKEGLEEKIGYDLPEKRFRKHWTKEEIQKTLKDIGFEAVKVQLIADTYGKVWMQFFIRKIN
ncbi:MAG: hypothetical protein M3M85_00790, partial [bacterium]|nr:hypothetical protein [bacterium]